MKAVPVLLLNVTTVVVGLLVYDQLRGDDTGSSSERATSSRSEPGESIQLERRLQQIEAKLAALPQGKDGNRAAADELKAEIGRADEAGGAEGEKHLRCDLRAWTRAGEVATA